MSGEKLYEIWVAANDEHDCNVESWDELDDFDRAVWQTMADKLP